MKECRHCHVEKPLDQFYKQPSGFKGVTAYRKDCNKIRANEWRLKNPEKRKEQRRKEYAKPENRERQRKYQKEYRKNFPERHRETNKKWIDKNKDRIKIANDAGNKLRAAVRAGEIIRPNQCERCEKENIPIEGAHYDYSKPLEVKWLCRSCHRKWDAEEPKTISTD